jgi:hypothetical protein
VALALLLPALFPARRARWVASDYKLPQIERGVRKRVPAWLASSDADRRGRRLPFDPVHAQARGLLPPAAVAGIREWGTLPPTWHVRQLARLGHVGREEISRHR